MTDAKLPEGYTVHPATMDDLETVTGLINICAKKLYDNVQYEADVLRTRWTMPDFDMATSTWMVFSPDKEIAGYGEVRGYGNPPLNHYIRVQVHPVHEGKGIGTFLNLRAAERAKEAIPRCLPEARIVYQTEVKTGYEAGETLLKNLGMKAVRYFWRMKIEMSNPPPIAQFPDGIHIRTMQYPDELSAAVAMSEDAFQDHYGYVARPIEDVVKRWQHSIENDSLFDSALWFLAIDDASSEIAGGCFNRAEAWDDSDSAYVIGLDVRRPWRKRGIGLALLHHSFGELWKRGRKTITLHVDASNITGATRLYEKAGMHTDRQTTRYEKEIRAGTNLATTSVE